MNVYFTCADCDLVGERDGTAEKHTKTTGHMTITGTDPERLARMREAPGAWAIETACDGYAALWLSDVPDGPDPDSYIAGAKHAAEGIRDVIQKAARK